MTFNPDLYQASLETLIDNGVPENVASAASAVVAKDDPHQENLGRTEKDQQVVDEAVGHMNRYWQGQSNE
ncbi:hypothetical protein I8752_22620 [Nostocaceae cyanobacterium CENA369]|uniref:Uncharacterized protein n=1 Tax=Dendronalium phyllosphericum CENA369 TaxID=1725256 RepID=A0A8J7IF77_9NOST|nr:hypothetical protein [Dendronalium phyllosphericum]MBH8575747.1 hypothetical protein [Dendronalium phyllosphericum CENA369]